MITTTARIATEQAERLILRLCKHWGHKFPVQHEPQRGEIELPFGKCRLYIHEALIVELEGEAAQMEKFQQVVAEHLQRMALKETLAIQWGQV